MGDDYVLPSLNSIERITIFSDNLTNDKRIGRKFTRSTTEEAVECISNAISTWKTSEPSISSSNNSNLMIHGNEALETVSNSVDRQTLKISVKILLVEPCPDYIKGATESVINELDVSYVDMVILALPPNVLKDDDARDAKIKLEDLKDYWKALEDLVNSGLTTTIGFSDLDTNLLKELHSWAKIKPGVNQINMISCCVTPPELTAFAKENGIQLLTHSDSKEILPRESTEKILQLLSPELSDEKKWNPLCVVRYVVLAKFRGVVTNKRYALSAGRHT